MKTYIKDNILHVELTQEENQAVHCAAWVAPVGLNDKEAASVGRAILDEVERSHLASVHAHRKPVAIKVTVATPEAPTDALDAQREAWAQHAAFATPFPLDVCRIVATHATSENEADIILELAEKTGRGPQSLLDAVQQYHATEAPRKGWTPNKQKP